METIKSLAESMEIGDFSEASTNFNYDFFDLKTMKEYEDRRLYLMGEVEEDVVHRLVKDIIAFNSQDEGLEVKDREPIMLYISSVGGAMDDGFKLVDIIESSITPVYTIALGYAYSMAFYILLAGHKRFATKRSILMMHDGECMIGNSLGKVFDQINFQRSLSDMIKAFTLTHSRLTEAEYDQKYRVDWFMLADDGLKYGFIDKIVGEDCTFADIL